MITTGTKYGVKYEIRIPKIGETVINVVKTNPKPFIVTELAKPEQFQIDTIKEYVKPYDNVNACIIIGIETNEKGKAKQHKEHCYYNENGKPFRFSAGYYFAVINCTESEWYKVLALRNGETIKPNE